jgi:alkylation response protein AidB-like acyl-CoA dehydrogenase
VTATSLTAPVLDAVLALAPSISARSPEIEDARRLPPDLLDDLVAAGCFRMLRPRSHGGEELPLPDAMRVVEALSRADASVGWTVMIGAGTWLDLAGLPRPTFDAIFAGHHGADTMIAGAFSPSGMAVPVDGGYRVSGRWAFASGIPHADWVYGNCVEETGGGHRLRIVLFQLDEITVEDTWHVVGLRGTGSHHFHADNVVVPADRTWPILEGTPSVEATVLRLPTPTVFALLMGAMALGVAAGALDDVIELATTKVPLLAPAPLATNPTFHHRLATAATSVRAARAGLHDVAADAWESATAGALGLHQRAAARAAACHAMDTAVDAVTMAFRAGGGGSVYLDSPLQRRLRDINAAAQHFLVRPDTMTTAGAVMAGQDLTVPVF